MPLLAEYAVTPDVFDTTSYSSEEVCRLLLQSISEVLTTEGLVRDLRGGEWRALFKEDSRTWHRRGKELLKKLAMQGRLIEHEPVNGTPPVDDGEWCEEALNSHSRSPMGGGVIATQSVKAKYISEPLVASIDRLTAAPWWVSRSSSVRLARNTAEYRHNLEPILRCANSLQFIDPHLDPTRHQYREFVDLLVYAGHRQPAPLIEIHRVCYEGSGPSRRILNLDDLERDFRRALARPLAAAGLQATVFIWDDFHDRHLISNLVGVSLPNGFDTTNDPRSVTTWTRLGRNDRDDVQKEFDKSSGRHAIRRQFTI